LAANIPLAHDRFRPEAVPCDGNLATLLFVQNRSTATPPDRVPDILTLQPEGRPTHTWLTNSGSFKTSVLTGNWSY